MDYFKEIQELKEERAELKAQLTSEGISEQEKLVIRQQVIAIDNQITMWGSILKETLTKSPQSGNPNIPAIPSTLHDIIKRMWEGVGSVPSAVDEVKDQVYHECGRMCVVSERTRGRLRVAHIVPKKNYRENDVLEALGWSPDDVNANPNLILLREDLEMSFDNAMWCFIPAVAPTGLCHQCGLPAHPKKRCPTSSDLKYVPFRALELCTGALGTFSGKVVFLPERTSRRALYLQAYQAHCRYNNVKNMPSGESYASSTKTGTPPKRIVDFVEEQVQQWKRSTHASAGEKSRSQKECVGDE